MANLVLYRKYRPQNFSEVVGQEHIVKTLTNEIKDGMISHAYLFCGPRGTGKTTLARIFAKAVNCQNLKGYEPCNKCSSCLEINEGRAIDLVEIDAASHRGIDDIREVRDGIKFYPTKLKYKVFIFDEAHQLSKEAANALLKTLEEPPSHAIFILATTEAHKMIATIISRCQRFDFRKLTLAEIIGRLENISKKEDLKIDRGALELIAFNAAGSIRDAESLLDQVFAFSKTLGKRGEIKPEEIKDLLGLVELNLIIKFVDHIFNKNAKDAITLLNEAADKGSDLQEFSKSLINYLRQVLITKIMGEDVNPMVAGLTKDEIQTIKNQALKLEEEKMQNIINLFLDAENKMRYSPIPQLPLELAIIEAVK